MAIIKRNSQNNRCFVSISQLFDEWIQSIRHKVKKSTAANYRLKAQNLST